MQPQSPNPNIQQLPVSPNTVPNPEQPLPAPEAAPVPAPVAPEVAPPAPQDAPVAPASAPVDPLSVPPVVDPAAPVAPASDPVPAAPAPGSLTPAIADDVDIIEKEWVDQANKVIDQTKDDPFVEEEAVEALQQDYLKKRYGHDVKKPDEL